MYVKQVVVYVGIVFELWEGDKWFSVVYMVELKVEYCVVGFVRIWLQKKWSKEVKVGLDELLGFECGLYVMWVLGYNRSDMGVELDCEQVWGCA